MKKLSIGALLLLSSAHAMAQTQQVRVSVENVAQGEYEASVYYQVTGNAKTTGLGVKLHYVSSAVTIASAGSPEHFDWLLEDAFLLAANQPDVDNLDSNSQTDRFLNFAWANQNAANWPTVIEGDTLLFRFRFTSNLPANSNVIFNLSSSGTAAGYTFAGTPFNGPLPVVVPEPDPAPEPTPTPTPTPTPEPTPVQTVEDLNNEVDAIVVEETGPISQDTVTRVDSALGKTTALAEQVTKSLPEGSAGVTVAMTALDTMNKTLNVTTSVSEKGGQVAPAAVVNSLNSVASVLSAMSTRSADITPEQRTAVQTITSNTVNNSSRMISSASTKDELVNLVAATSAVINAASDAGADLSNELVAQAEQLVSKAVKTGISSFSANIDPEDPVQVEALLRSNPEALEFAISASVAVKSRIRPDTAALDAELSDRGISTEVSESLGNVLTAVANPDGVTVGGISATDALLSALVQFLTAPANAEMLVSELVNGRFGVQMAAATSSGISLDVDPLTGQLLISAPGEEYAAAVVSTRIVSASMPQGVSYLRDGRALVVANGIAIEIAPVAVDLIGLTSAVKSAGFSMSMQDNGAVDIALGGGERLVGAFAYDNVASLTGSCGTLGIEEPAGSPSAADYAYVLVCADGTTQRLVPFVHDRAFYRSVADLGFTINTDRNSGYITISGLRFKPGFFVSPLSVEDAAYLAANKNAQGVAFRLADINGDGVEDAVLMTQAGAQPIYGVPSL